MYTPSDDPEVAYRSPRRPRTLNGTQVMFAIIIAIALMLAINFSSRVGADRDLRRVRDAVQRDLDTLKIEQRQLVDRLGFVQGEAFIEQWARSEGRMVREGDILIVLFPSQSAAPVATIEPLTVMSAPADTQPVPSWQLWWALFFDVSPPGS